MELKTIKIIQDEKGLAKLIDKLTCEILNQVKVDNLVLIGIQTRGVPLSLRIAKKIKEIEKKEVPVGVLDINLYRDDINSIGWQPVVKETNIPFDITDTNVVIVDDVIYTGRTVRSALNALNDFGRPLTIKLAVLVDRGNRELPIQPDFVGIKIKVSSDELVVVELKEVDKKDRIVLKRKI